MLALTILVASMTIEDFRHIGEIFKCHLQPKLLFRKVSCKIFEHFALQVDPVRHSFQKTAPLWRQKLDGATLAPKLAAPPSGGKATPTPPPIKLDPGYLIWIDSYFVLFKDVS